MERFERVSLSIIMFIFFLTATQLFSGIGVIKSDADLIIHQSHQRILVAFNGEEELLVFSNVLSGNKRERVVRFIPLPAKPEVSMAKEAIFADTAKVLNVYNDRFISCYKGDIKPERLRNNQSVSYPQTMPEKISVFEVDDIHYFSGLLDEYITTGNLSLRFSPSDGEVISGYIERGFRFFVLDTVEIYQENQFIQPLVYKFRTDKLVYPLEILNSFEGEGILEIYVFSSQRKIADDISLYLPFCRNCEDVYASEILENEWSRFPAPLATFFNERAFFKIYVYRGSYIFRNDIEIKYDKIVPNAGISHWKSTGNTDESSLSLHTDNETAIFPAGKTKRNQRKQIVTGGKKDVN